MIALDVIIIFIALYTRIAILFKQGLSLNVIFGTIILVDFVFVCVYFL